MDTPVLAYQQKLIHQLYVNIGYRLKDLSRGIANMDEWQDSQDNLMSVPLDDYNYSMLD